MSLDKLKEDPIDRILATQNVQQLLKDIHKQLELLNMRFEETFESRINIEDLIE